MFVDFVVVVHICISYVFRVEKMPIPMTIFFSTSIVLLFSFSFDVVDLAY